MQYVRNVEDANEIVNDTFIVIWEKQGELELNEQLKPLLYTIVRNKSLNLIKKKKLDLGEWMEGFEIISNEPSTTELIEAKQTEELIFLLIEQLPPKCKQIFVLSRKEFLSNKSIAEVLEISEKTVENQITIAIKFIKKGLQNHQLKDGSKNYSLIFPWLIGTLLIGSH